MSTPTRKVIFLTAVVSTAAAMLVPASAMAGSPGSSFVPTGNAWGTFVKVGQVAKSGHTALAVLGCGPTSDSNDVAAVHVPGIKTGVVRSRTHTFSVKGGDGSQSVNVIHDVNLLNGRITADAVRAVSRTSYDGSRFEGGGRGSEFVGLRIAGKKYSAKDSGRVDLPGIGYVQLNRQTRASNGAEHVTHMIVVHVTRNVPSLQLTAGTVIIVGHALTAVKRVGGVLGGYAFGSQAVVAGVPVGADAGRSALVYVSCHGTDGAVLSNQILNLSVPSVFGLSTVQSTAQGEVHRTRASLRLTDTIEQADVLQGLIDAKGIRAVAEGSIRHGVRHFDSRGSRFAELSVKGFPAIDVSVQHNTRVSIPGLGTLWLHRVIRSDNQIEVRMIELQVRKPNALGLPVAADVQVGVARAVIKNPRAG
jgi:hypothetical protein